MLHHQDKQLIAFGLTLSLDDTFLLEVRPELVVAPCRVDLSG